MEVTLLTERVTQKLLGVLAYEGLMGSDCPREEGVSIGGIFDKLWYLVF